MRNVTMIMKGSKNGRRRAAQSLDPESQRRPVKGIDTHDRSTRPSLRDAAHHETGCPSVQRIPPETRAGGLLLRKTERTPTELIRRMSIRNAPLFMRRFYGVAPALTHSATRAPIPRRNHTSQSISSNRTKKAVVRYVCNMLRKHPYAAGGKRYAPRATQQVQTVDQATTGKALHERSRASHSGGELVLRMIGYRSGPSRALPYPKPDPTCMPSQPTISQQTTRHHRTKTSPSRLKHNPDTREKGMCSNPTPGPMAPPVRTTQELTPNPIR